MSRRLVIVEAGPEFEFPKLGFVGMDAADLAEVRCDRCRHWDPERASGADERAGACQVITNIGLSARVIADTRSWIETQPDFGCSTFNKKEGTTTP